jgi:hypothetical protein
MGLFHSLIRWSLNRKTSFPKLFPVPWESLAPLPSEGIFFLNQSKEQMGKAPAFDKEKRLTDFIDKKEVLPGYLGPAFYLVGPWQAKTF